MAGKRGAAQQRNRLAPFNDFLSAARAVVELLHPRLGYGLVMVTRIEGDRMRVIAVADSVYGLQEKDELSWSHSLCRAVAEGIAPPIASDITGIPGLAEAVTKEAEAGRPVRSHMGLALVRPDGSLYGTICAADPQPRPRDVTGELPLFELMAQLLSTVLAGEAKTASEIRRAELAEEESLVDGLSGLSNRRAWDRHLDIEENRSRRYGIPVSVVVVDLDHLCSRTGGDEFAILAVDCDETAAEALAERVEQTLVEKGVQASLGWATRDPITGLQEAVRRADERMFENKRNKRSTP
jgi:diguanylate cyclase